MGEAGGARAGRRRWGRQRREAGSWAGGGFWSVGDGADGGRGRGCTGRADGAGTVSRG